MDPGIPDVVFAPLAAHKQFKTREASTAFTVVHDAVKTGWERAKRAGKFPREIPGRIVPEPPQSAQAPPSQPTTDLGAEKDVSSEKICIVGAGAAGLYAAMILESLNIDYEILEANDRIGGRLYTHRFNGDLGLNAPIGTPARYDYFDVGAMRFPDVPFIKRVWDLFNRIQIKGLLVDYKLSAENTFQHYNTAPPLNVPITRETAKNDYFRVSVSKGGTVPDEFVKHKVSYWTGLVYGPYRDMFKKLDDKDLTNDEQNKIFKGAWDHLTAQDHHTTRSAMREGLNDVRPYPNSVIEWVETFDSATGLYDHALILTGRGPKTPSQLPTFLTRKQKETDWFCIDGGGGSDHIAKWRQPSTISRP